MEGMLRSAMAGQGSRPEVRKGRVDLQRLGERHATLGAEVVVAEAAHTAKAG